MASCGSCWDTPRAFPGATKLPVDAYQKGLKLQGTSPEGISGLAQTYGKMGRVDEAKRMLMQVINAHPDRINDILMPASSS